MNRIVPRQFKELLWEIIFGKPDESSFEERLTIATCFVVAIASIIIAALNYFLGLSDMVTMTIVLFLTSGTYFLLARFGKFSRELQCVILATGVIFLNLFWYFNFGSRGPILNIFIVLYAFFIFVWDRKHVLLISAIFFLNILILFGIEHVNPAFVGDYPTELVRIEDSYIGNIIAMLLMLIFSLSVKRNYLKQYFEARRSDQLKSAFLANMSHEVRTPLNAIVGFSSLITDCEYDKETRNEFQKIININSDYLLQLIEDIIDLSKIEVESLVLNYRPVDISVLFERLKCNHNYLLDDEEKGEIDFKYEIDLPSYTLNTDPIRLEQILRNLISNAIKFTREGSVVFGCKRENGLHTFYVRDTGIGIRKENLTKIFDRFIKIEEDPKLMTRGTGIGLFLSKILVEKLGGTISVESTYQQGSVFTFTVKDIQD